MLLPLLVALLQERFDGLAVGTGRQLLIAETAGEVLGLHDEELSQELAVYAASSLDERITNAYAERVFTFYANALARHLDEILDSPHPPID